MQVTDGVTAFDRNGDLLMLAFNQACLSGDLAVAASLLQKLDAVLLGSAMAWGQRESSLKLMRSMCDRLDNLRADAWAERPAINAVTNGARQKEGVVFG